MPHLLADIPAKHAHDYKMVLLSRIELIWEYVCNDHWRDLASLIEIIPKIEICFEGFDFNLLFLKKMADLLSVCNAEIKKILADNICKLLLTNELEIQRNDVIGKYQILHYHLQLIIGLLIFTFVNLHASIFLVVSLKK